MKRRVRYLAFALLVGSVSLVRAQQAAVDEPGRLGAATRSPTNEEAGLFCLTEIAGRWSGQVIGEVREQGAAAAAGLRAGDMLVALDGSPLYSRDDIEDLLAVAKPGSHRKAKVKRADTFRVEEVELTVPEMAAPAGIRWQYAGPVELQRALEFAKKDGKRVLVGLSGAET